VRQSMVQISDPVTGAAHSQAGLFDAANRRISDQVAALEERISTMQSVLRAKLQGADVLLASLTSQQSLLTASVDSLNYTTYGRENK
jgi:hypothetical protein